MKKILFIIIFFSLSERFFGQINLISNPSFEDSLGIPLTHSELFKCSNWHSVIVSPDYYSIYSPTATAFPQMNMHIPLNDLGYQYPKDGNFYAGIAVTNYFDQTSGSPFLYANGEMLRGELLQPLVQDRCYRFTMYYSVAEGSPLSGNQLQIYFSASQYTIAVNPSTGNFYHPNVSFQVELDTNTYMTDTINWVPISGTFVAQGGEKFLTIGNFRNSFRTKFIPLNSSSSSSNTFYNSCYIYLDDLSLFEVDNLYAPANCRNDTAICQGDSINLGYNITDPTLYNWHPTTGLSCFNCPNPKVKPTETTTYILKKFNCNIFTIDTVKINILNGCLYNSEFFYAPNVFTPNNDGINDSWGFVSNDISKIIDFSLQIYNRWGINVFSTDPDTLNPNTRWYGQTYSGVACEEGAYFYIVKYTLKDKGVQILKGNISLFR